MNVISTNPVDGSQTPLDIAESSAEDVLRLTRRAGESARGFAARPLEWRASLLESMADELESDATNLVATAARETALTVARLEGELRRTAYQLRFFANVVREGSFLGATVDHPTESPMGPLPDLRRLNVPRGPVAVFGSSNFPFAFSVPGGDTASALAAGCPVVIKAHPAHPATSAACFAALERAALRAGAPAGVLGLVYGLDAGRALVDAPAITAVGFTGSVAAGRALWRRALERATPIPFYGELGAANPLVVTPAALARAHEIGVGAAGSMTLGVGQFCTKPGLLFVPAGDGGDELVAALHGALDEMGAMTMLSSSIADHFRDGVHAWEAVEGCRRVAGGDDGDDAQVSARLYEVDAATFARARVLREECFGPVALVVRYAETEELRTALAHADASLTFSLFVGEVDDDAEWLLEAGAASSGRVIVNGYPTGVAVSWSMHHGGPWPSTTDAAATSVGAAALGRWLRPVSFQGVPDHLLPEAVRDANPLEIPRRVDGVAS